MLGFIYHDNCLLYHITIMDLCDTIITLSILLHITTSNDMIKTLFPNLSKIGAICLSIPVTTASVERSFSQMKLIKTRLRSSLNGKSLSNLMKIALEFPDELTDSHLEEVVNVWNRKSRRIVV